jgi:hypothetical protein
MINETTSSKLIYLVDFYYNYNDDVVSFYIVINDNDDMKNIRHEIINKIEYDKKMEINGVVFIYVRLFFNYVNWI